MSKEKDPAVLLYTQDFIVGSMVMSFEEKGKYITILCMQHQMGHLSEETICNIIGSFSDNLKKKFVQDENGLFFNIRMEKEIEKREKYSESRSKNGSNGGRPPKEKKHTKSTKKAQRNHMVSVCESIDKAYENHSEDENENEIYSFDSFWNDYEKKVGKEKASVKWKLLTEAEKLLIKEYIPRYKIAQPEPRFRKDPERFINYRVWEDEIIGIPQKPVKNESKPENHIVTLR